MRVAGVDVPRAGECSITPLVLAGLGLIAAAAANLAVAALPTHYRDTRLTLDGLGSWPAVASGYGVGLAVAFGCYVVAWRRARHVPPTRRNVLLVCLLPVMAGALLLPTYPLLSRDFFYTVMSGRVLAHYHQNPFQVAPGNSSADPFLPYADWHQLTDPYGPLWALIVGAVGRLPGDGLLATFMAFKAVLFAGYLGATGVLGWLLMRLAPDRLLSGLVLWAWNPLVLLETVANGHHDVIMLALVLLAFALAVQDRPTPALVSLMMAGAVKQAAFGLLPLLVVYLLTRRPKGRRAAVRLVPGVVISAALLAVLYAAFWVGWQPTVFGFFHQTQFYISSPSALARLVLLHWFRAPEPAIRAAAVLIGSVCYVRLVWHARDGTDALLSSAYGAMLTAILVWQVFYPWYILWLVAVAATRASGRVSRQVFAVSVAAGMSYLYLYGIRDASAHSPQFWSAAEAVTVFGTLLATAIWYRLEVAYRRAEPGRGTRSIRARPVR